MAQTTKAGSYHIRFPESVTKWLKGKQKSMGYDVVQDVVRHLVQQAYLQEQEQKRDIRANRSQEAMTA